MRASGGRLRRRLVALALALALLSVALSVAAVAAGGDHNFHHDFDVVWGAGNTRFRDGGRTVELSLDERTGARLQSKQRYLFGKFDLKMKLVPGGEGADEQWPDQHGQQQQQQQPAALDDELPALFEALRAKEAVALAGEEDGYGGAAGREVAVGWASPVAARLGFSALAATYLDRCFLGGALRLGDQPWMARLAAIACVALAAKVEETRVPLLPDLQLCTAASSGADADAGDPYVFVRAPDGAARALRTLSRPSPLKLSGSGR